MHGIYLTTSTQRAPFPFEFLRKDDAKAGTSRPGSGRIPAPIRAQSALQSLIISGPAHNPQFRHQLQRLVENLGGGTAGCVLARKLSDSGEHSVLVLEAGILPDPGLDVPALASSFLSNSNYTRTYYSVPQQNADLENGGGRAHAGRTETYSGVFPATDQHGYDGPINVSLPKYVPLLNEWLSAGQFLCYPISVRNDPQQISFCPSEYSKRRGRRVSSYAGYLKPVLGQRKNLKVILKAEARRIIFNGNQAIGVQFRSSTDGFPTDNVVFARNEIIVSAGAVETCASDEIWDETQASSQCSKHPSCKMSPRLDRTQEYLNEVGDCPFAAYSGFGGQAFISTTAQGNQTKVRDIQLFHLVAPGVPILYPNRPNIQTAPWEVATSAFVLYLTHPTDMKIMLDGNLLLFYGTELGPVLLIILSSLMFSGTEMTMKIFENTPQFKNWGLAFLQTNFQIVDVFNFNPGVKFIGIRGLRVVDASIMPVITNVNLQAAVYVTAEKASDMILRQGRISQSSKNTLRFK
ncbi:hypothetical protein Ocin01_16667 [Orchesella cincta]|uniref:Oxygen-dependent choline dehydrogenase n=1 Tax=Orchesella cincta TaxID=48709 RepID=A0A1D2MAJ5_ORCCI|nr:hypothetical protein Ocin01_16667 [Orchesella cincta]